MTSAASSHLEHLSKAAIRLIDYGVCRVWYEAASFYSGFLFDREKARVLLPVHSYGAFLIFAFTSGKTELTEVKGVLDNNVQGRFILIVFGICTSIGSLSTPPLCLLPYICR